MRVSAEGTKIKLRREGLFLCLDGSQPSGIWENVCHFLDLQSRNYDVSLRYGLLSWGEVLEGAPSREFAKANELALRGRFITPLAESVFKELERDSLDLLIFAEERPFDFQDWVDYFSEIFHKIIQFNEWDLGNTQHEMEEHLLHKVLDFSIDRVSLRFKGCVPHTFDTDFDIRVRDNEIELVKECGAPKVEFDLVAFSPSGNCSCLLNDRIELELPSIEPDTMAMDEMISDERECEAFQEAISGYREGQSEHQCPACGTKHKFIRAFKCGERLKAGVLSTRDSVMFSGVDDVAGSARYLVLRPEESCIRWQVLDKPVLYFGEGVFLINTRGGGIKCLKVSENLVLSDPREIFRDLFELPSGLLLLKR